MQLNVCVHWHNVTARCSRCVSPQLTIAHHLTKVLVAQWLEYPTSVTEMLNELNWRSLQQRRADAPLIMLYRITNNLVEVNPGDNLRSPNRRSRHIHDHCFIPISTSTTSHRLSCYPRTIVQWNSLPPDVLTLSADPAQFRINVSKITHQLVI